MAGTWYVVVVVYVLIVLMSMTVMIHLISGSSVCWYGIHVKGVRGLFVILVGGRAGRMLDFFEQVE